MLPQTAIIHLIVCLLICAGSDLHGQVIVEKDLAVKYTFNGTDIEGAVRMRMECLRRGRVDGPSNQNRPNLLFPGDKGLIRVNFYNLKLPDIKGISKENCSLIITKSDVQRDNPGTKVRWGPGRQEKKLVALPANNIRFNLEIPKGGKYNLKLSYGLDYGTGLISVNNGFSQSVLAIVEEELWTRILEGQSNWKSSQYIASCEDYIDYFSNSTSEDREKTVKKKLADLDIAHWGRTNKNMPSSLVNYLKLFKNPGQKIEAINLLKDLNTNSWNNTKAVASIRAFDEYLKRFEGINMVNIPTYVDSARRQIKLIDQQEWEKARKAHKPQAYSYYLGLFKGTRVTPKYRREANRGKNIPEKKSSVPRPIVRDTDPDEIVWELADSLHTVEAYQMYLDECDECEFEEEAERRILQLSPIEVNVLRDSSDIFRYSVTLASTRYPWIDSITNREGVQIVELVSDSISGDFDFIIQDRENHIFFILDSLGKKDTFSIDASIPAIVATASTDQAKEHIVFMVEGGIPPYYVQFESHSAERGRKIWRSRLHKLGDSSKHELIIPIQNLSPEIEAGNYTILVKDSRQTEYARIENFELIRPPQPSLWIYLIGPLLLLVGFLLYRNIEIG